MTNVFCTGASGFIGGYVVDELLRYGHGVTVLLRPTSDASRFRGTDVRCVSGDVTDSRSLHGLMNGADTIIHLAAVVGKNPGGWKHHRDIGVQGTRNVIDAAVAANVRRFIHLSSFAVYARCSRGIHIDEDFPMERRPESWNHYGRQKVLSELLVWEAHHQQRIRVTTIRPPNVLGPGDPNLVPYIEAVMRSPLGLFANDGENRIPLVAVEELAVAIVRAMSSEVTVGKAYNVAGQEQISKSRFLGYFSEAGLRPMQRRSGSQMLIDAGAASARVADRLWRIGGRRDQYPVSRLAVALLERHAHRRYQEDCVLDCSRAARDLGWRSEADYRAAVFRTMEWYRQHTGRSSARHSATVQRQ